MYLTNDKSYIILVDKRKPRKKNTWPPKCHWRLISSRSNVRKDVSVVTADVHIFKNQIIPVSI